MCIACGRFALPAWAVLACSWRSVRIDGGTSVDERQSIVDNFNTRGIGQVRKTAQPPPPPPPTCLCTFVPLWWAALRHVTSLNSRFALQQSSSATAALPYVGPASKRHGVPRLWSYTLASSCPAMLCCPQVFLLSTRAGGAGLNLIGANHLVRGAAATM